MLFVGDGSRKADRLFQGESAGRFCSGIKIDPGRDPRRRGFSGPWDLVNALHAVSTAGQRDGRKRGAGLPVPFNPTRCRSLELVSVLIRRVGAPTVIFI